jgi:hypothetical protein
MRFAHCQVGCPGMGRRGHWGLSIRKGGVPLTEGCGPLMKQHCLGEPHTWHDPPFLPTPPALTCPANSHYELCSPACPPSCNSEARPTNCSSRPCVEGCVCLPGFVASRGLCMPVSSCGCIFQDRLLAPGQEVYADEKCHLRCTCDGATQKVICRNTTGCLPKEHCGVQNGSFGCFPEYFRICRASGDPHYMSLDERIFNFMGTCTYLFTASCGQHPSLPDFKVFIENERRGSQSVSFVRSVKLEALGIKLEVRREYQGKVLVSAAGRERGGGGQIQGRSKAVVEAEWDSFNDLVAKVQALLLFLVSVTVSQTVLPRSEIIVK